MNRDPETGRFIKGHSVKSPGRPPRRVEREYLDTLKAELSMSKWVQIVRRAISDATKGDRHAREWLANYAVGRAPHIIELSAVDAALLSDVLEALPEDVSASSVFEAMLQELALVEGDDDETA